MFEVNITIEQMQPIVDITVDNSQPKVEVELNGFGGGGIAFETDETLILDENNVLRVNTASEVEEDNTLPITSAAVATQIGNIEILLKTI